MAMAAARVNSPGLQDSRSKPTLRHSPRSLPSSPSTQQSPNGTGKRQGTVTKSARGLAQNGAVSGGRGTPGDTRSRVAAAAASADSQRGQSSQRANERRTSPGATKAGAALPARAARRSLAVASEHGRPADMGAEEPQGDAQMVLEQWGATESEDPSPVIMRDMRAPSFADTYLATDDSADFPSKNDLQAIVGENPAVWPGLDPHAHEEFSQVDANGSTESVSGWRTQPEPYVRFSEYGDASDIGEPMLESSQSQVRVGVPVLHALPQTKGSIVVDVEQVNGPPATYGNPEADILRDQLASLEDALQAARAETRAAREEGDELRQQLENARKTSEVAPQPRWSAESAYNLGADSSRYEGKAPLLAGFEGVSSAIQALKAGKRSIPSSILAKGFCVVFHTGHQTNFLLYRSDKAKMVGELFGFEPRVLDDQVAPQEARDDITEAQVEQRVQEVQRLQKDVEAMEALTLRLCEAIKMESLQKDVALAELAEKEDELTRAKAAAKVDEGSNQRSSAHTDMVDARNLTTQLAELLGGMRAGDDPRAAFGLVSRLQALLSGKSSSQVMHVKPLLKASHPFSGSSSITDGTNDQPSVCSPKGISTSIPRTVGTAQGNGCRGIDVRQKVVPVSVSCGPSSPNGSIDMAMSTYSSSTWPTKSARVEPPLSTPNLTRVARAEPLSPAAHSPRVPRRQLSGLSQGPSLSMNPPTNQGYPTGAATVQPTSAGFAMPLPRCSYLGGVRPPITTSRSSEIVVPLAAATPVTAPVAPFPPATRSVVITAPVPVTRGRSASPTPRVAEVIIRRSFSPPPVSEVTRRSFSPPPVSEVVRRSVSPPPVRQLVTRGVSMPVSPRVPLDVMVRPSVITMPSPVVGAAAATMAPTVPTEPNELVASPVALADGRIVRRHYKQQWVLDHEENVGKSAVAM
eukprot:TRINITY_DN18909_c0_g1_i1.p1 TRINITY_DN18909_c0_g1~~TRINITY_DN18909_c0_g1_i1.p1  ORF type:complete len:919 (+),score=140.35 TRINITY_DN18909_c0_g1_i1:112-2868(+)